MRMYDASLRPIVLQKLDRWGRLTEGDLEAMLTPIQRARLRDDLIKDLEWEGMLETRVVGDEAVLSITERGREWLASHAQRGGQA